MKKALIIGGTGTISAAVTSLLLKKGWEVHLLNRGNIKDKLIHPEFNLDGAKLLQADINDVEAVKSLVKNEYYDSVADFITYDVASLKRNCNIFKGKTNQYIFISSASAYQKPLSFYKITESTPLANPYWEYSRNKIACEEYLNTLYTSEKFPITIVRPSHTYDQRSIPLALHGLHGSWQTITRIVQGKPVLLHGDGNSLWTFTHSRDFAKAFTGLMANIHSIGQAVHITSDESLTWNQAVFSIAAALGKKAEVVYAPSNIIIREGKEFGYDFCGALLGDKANSVVFDNSKIKNLVPEYCATTRYDEGVAESIEWYLQNPVLQKSDPEFEKFIEHIAGNSFTFEKSAVFI